MVVNPIPMAIPMSHSSQSPILSISHLNQEWLSYVMVPEKERKKKKIIIQNKLYYLAFQFILPPIQYIINRLGTCLLKSYQYHIIVMYHQYHQHMTDPN